MENFLACFVTHCESYVQDVKTIFGDEGFFFFFGCCCCCRFWETKNTIAALCIFFYDNSEIHAILWT